MFLALILFIKSANKKTHTHKKQQQQPPYFVYEEILWLQISVENIVGVAKWQSPQQLVQERLQTESYIQSYIIDKTDKLCLYSQ